MIITTSRRPSHLARILCRELVRVIPKSRYVPRGVKTVEEVASIARELGHDRVMIVNSVSGKPRELRFLEVGQRWRWENAKVEIGEVKLQRDLGQRNKLEDTKIYAQGAKALEFAEWFGKLLGFKCLDKLPASGGIALIISNDGLKLQFQVMPSSEAVGPVLQITGFGRLYKE